MLDQVLLTTCYVEDDLLGCACRVYALIALIRRHFLCQNFPFSLASSYLSTAWHFFQNVDRPEKLEEKWSKIWILRWKLHMREWNSTSFTRYQPPTHLILAVARYYLHFMSLQYAVNWVFIKCCLTVETLFLTFSWPDLTSTHHDQICFVH